MLKVYWILAMMFSCAAQSPAPGGLTGTLTGSDGTPITGGTLSLSSTRIPPRNPSGRPSLQAGPYVTRSGAGGTLRFEQLPAGSYLVCAQAPRNQWLGSCDWGAKPQIVSVAAGVTGNLSVVLRKGALVPIRVDDPNRTLSQSQAKGLLVGVGGDDKLFRPAVLLSEDAGGRTYESLIPFDFPVKLVLASPSFQLANEQGTPLPAKTTVITYTAPAAQTPPAVRVIVTGARVP